MSGGGAKKPSQITLSDLSLRQQQCLEWLYFWTEVEPRPITLTGLSHAMGMLRHHGAKWHVDRLAKMGLASRVAGMPGTVRATRAGLRLGKMSAHKCSTPDELKAVLRKRSARKKKVTR